MRFLCLMYTNEQDWMKLPKDELMKLSAEYQAFAEKIQKSGHLVVSNGLAPTKSAITVQMRSGKLSTTDGPFAETKEQLGGFYLIEAKDQQEAVQIAGGIPAAKYGKVEVRPIWPG